MKKWQHGCLFLIFLLSFFTCSIAFAEQQSSPYNWKGLYLGALAGGVLILKAERRICAH